MKFASGNWKFDPKLTVVWLIGICWLVYGTFFASTGFFTSDEVFYATTIRHFATTGSFFIENGYDLVQAESLRLVILIPGVHGLVMQYPIGYVILAAPFYLLGGLHGVILLNTLASVLSLFLTYKIARKLFADEDLAATAALLFGLATFAVDYAFAIWPHATSNAIVAGGIYAAVLSVKDVQKNWRWAALAGLVIGLGVTVRIEVIIAAPILFVWMFINVFRPLRTMVLFTAALVLGLSVAAWLNYLKFGIFNPLSYGRNTGGTAFSSYVIYIPYAVMAGLMMMSLRWKPVRAWLTDKRLWLLLGISAVSLFAVPTSRELAVKIIQGLYVLLVDLEKHHQISDSPYFVQVGDSHYLFYGILKKSLLQSLPYLGLVIFMAAKVFRHERRAAYALALLMPLVWFLPFAPAQWIGGLANNMRYFSPVLPLLAIWAAVAWHEVASGGVKRLWLIQTVAVLLCAALMYAWASQSDTLGFINAFTTTVGVYLFGIILLLLSIIWLLLPEQRRRLRWGLLTAMQTSFVLAFISAYAGDLSVNQEHRVQTKSFHETLSYIEENSHVVADSIEVFSFQIDRPDATLAVLNGPVHENDIEFIIKSMEQGRPVYLAPAWVAQEVQGAMRNAGYEFGPAGYSIERSFSPTDGQHHHLYRLKRATRQ